MTAPFVQLREVLTGCGATYDGPVPGALRYFSPGGDVLVRLNERRDMFVVRTPAKVVEVPFDRIEDALRESGVADLIAGNTP